VEEQAKMQVHKEGTDTEEDRQKEDHQWCRAELKWNTITHISIQQHNQRCAK